MLKIYLKVILTIIIAILLGIQVWLNFALVSAIKAIGISEELTKKFLISSFPEQVKAFNDAQK